MKYGHTSKIAVVDALKYERRFPLRASIHSDAPLLGDLNTRLSWNVSTESLSNSVAPLGLAVKVRFG
jgi:hypothetical protein